MLVRREQLEAMTGAAEAHARDIIGAFEKGVDILNKAGMDDEQKVELKKLLTEGEQYANNGIKQVESLLEGHADLQARLQRAKEQVLGAVMGDVAGSIDPKSAISPMS